MLNFRTQLFFVQFFLAGLLLSGSLFAADYLPVSYYWNFEQPDTSAYWINSVTRTSADGNFYSHTDVNQPYGIGFKSSVPGGTGTHSMVSTLSFRLRSSAISATPKVVFSIERNGESVYWNSLDLADRLQKQDEWVACKNLQQIIPAEYTSPSYKFVCYVWNADGLASVDIDDFQISFEPLPNRSFLPALNTATAVAQGEFIDLYRGPFFLLQFDKINGQCRLVEKDYETVFDGIYLFKELRGAKGKDLQQQWSTFLTYQGDSLSEDGQVFKFGCRGVSTAELMLVIPRDGRSVGFNFSYTATQSIKLERLSIVLCAKIPMTKIYTGQGNVQESGFYEEYWLNKEGLTWSTKNSDWSIYHPEKVSSLQYDYLKNILWVNADYSGDHPLLYWPEGITAKNYRIDRSYSQLTPGEKLRCSFLLTRKDGDLPLPRFLDARDGREAVLIFTEHADYTSIRSNRAVYYGADTISNVQSSIGGFAGHHIPVTKSVFYSNPDKIDFSKRAGFIHGEIDNVSSTEGFRQFLSDLQAEGNEIALHTPDHYTSNSSVLSESFEKMSEFFRLKSWIDHGYDNAKKSNREDLVCDGFMKGSPLYLEPLFTTYGVKNLWNCFYEDSSLYEMVTFNSELVTPHPAFGFSYPRPVNWEHFSVSGNFRHLRTTCTLAPQDGSIWDFLLGEKRLEFLVKNKSVYVAHIYPARIDSVNAFYNWRSDVWSVDPGFDKVLSGISSYRQKGSLWVTTMADYLDYAVDKDNLRYSLDRSGFAVIGNPTDRLISGISMCVDGYDVQLTGKEVNRRKLDDCTIFWFDLAPGESTTVRLVTPH